MLGSVLSWILGSLSNLCWLFVYIPQIRENYRNSSCNAVSFYLILFWFIGDTLSSISAQYKEITSVVLYVSLYNICLDIIFLCQYMYYQFGDLINSEESENQSLLNENYNKFKFGLQPILNIFCQYEIIITLSYLITIGCIEMSFNHLSKRIIGEVYGWISAMMFISSRIPQIYLNYKRRSVRGLSFLTFSSIILANTLFLTSILINLIDLENFYQRSQYIIENLQWIMGSSVTSLLDMIILFQFNFMNKD